MKVLVTSNSFGKYSKEPLEKLQSAGFEVIFNPYHRMMNEAEFIQELKDVDALILSTEIVNKKVIDASQKLKMISRYGVGLDTIDLAYCEEKKIAVSVTQHGNSNAVAEYAIALMFATMRGVCYCAGYAKQNIWKKFTGLDITGKTIGIVGLGAIGREVAKKLSSFDMRILAYDVYYDDAFVEAYAIEKVSLEELLKNSDIITLHAPSTSDKPLLSHEQFQMMREHVVLINTARASLIDQKALIENLDNGKIFAAGFDVHADEPNYEDYLQNYENVILTPHTAAITKEATDKTSMMAVDNILHYFQIQ